MLISKIIFLKNIYYFNFQDKKHIKNNYYHISKYYINQVL
jgi:hypothetical protein